MPGKGKKRKMAVYRESFRSHEVAWLVRNYLEDHQYFKALQAFGEEARGLLPEPKIQGKEIGRPEVKGLRQVLDDYVALNIAFSETTSQLAAAKKRIEDLTSAREQRSVPGPQTPPTFAPAVQESQETTSDQLASASARQEFHGTSHEILSSAAGSAQAFQGIYETPHDIRSSAPEIVDLDEIPDVDLEFPSSVPALHDIPDVADIPSSAAPALHEEPDTFDIPSSAPAIDDWYIPDDIPEIEVLPELAGEVGWGVERRTPRSSRLMRWGWDTKVDPPKFLGPHSTALQSYSMSSRVSHEF